MLKATREMLKDEELLDWIADQTYNYYLSVNGREEEKTILQKELAGVDTSIDRLVSAIEAGAFNDRIKSRLDALNEQKAQITASIADLELASGFRLTRDHIAFFLRQFRDADLEDRACQKRLIQTFVNSVFVFDDRIEIVYNYTEGNNTVTLDILTSETDGGEFVHSTECSTIPIRYEPRGIIIFGTTFMITVQIENRGG